MTVKDLMGLLSTLPEDMEIIETRYSDYGPMHFDNWSVVFGVPSGSDWSLRVHPTMPESVRSKAKQYLHFDGN